MAKRKKKSKIKLSAKAIAIIAIILIIAIVGVLIFKTFWPDKYNALYNKIFGIETYEVASEEVLETSLTASGNLQIHFLELGNTYPGDCIYIKAGDKDILIDAGSETSSVPAIQSYLNQHMTDNILEYVIVTHAHEDHYAGFATPASTDSIFDLYVCETIITFSLTNQKETSNMYKNYLRELGEEIAAGATHLTADECVDEDILLSDGIYLDILDSYYYYNESKNENNYSVCCMIKQGQRNFLFTGDLENEGERDDNGNTIKGEEKLVEMNNLPNVVLYKAGHHGSKTSSSTTLLDAVKPEICVVQCVAGADPHGAKPENRFPSQAFIDRIAPYTSRVYVTTISTDWENKAYDSMNGCVIIESNAETLKLKFTKNNVRLKDSDWFKANRTCPAAWQN